MHIMRGFSLLGEFIIGGFTVHLTDQHSVISDVFRAQSRQPHSQRPGQPETPKTVNPNKSHGGRTYFFHICTFLKSVFHSRRQVVDVLDDVFFFQCRGTLERVWEGLTRSEEDEEEEEGKSLQKRQDNSRVRHTTTWINNIFSLSLSLVFHRWWIAA